MLKILFIFFFCSARVKSGIFSNKGATLTVCLPRQLNSLATP